MIPKKLALKDFPKMQSRQESNLQICIVTTKYTYLMKIRTMRKSLPQKFTYEMQLRQLEDEIKKEESVIAVLENKYLKKTKFCGNILTGFQDYILQKTLINHDDEELIIYPEDRIFSLSSVTSEASRQYAQLQKLPRKAGRQSRSSKNNNSKKKIKSSKILPVKQINQQKIEHVDMYQQLSIQSQYNREGSLYKRPQHFQDQRDIKSEDNLLDTLTQISFKSSQTLSVAQIPPASKKMNKKPQISNNIKRWLNKERKKARNISNNEQNQTLDIQIDEKLGICNLDQLKRKRQLQLEKQIKVSTKMQQQNSDSCDSVDKFIKLARRKRNN